MQIPTSPKAIALPFVLATLSTGILSGCLDTKSTPTPAPAEPGVISFDLLSSEPKLSLPNDLYLAAGFDPVNEDLGDPLVALKALDGWSTHAPFVIDVDYPTTGTRLLDASLENEEAVKIYQVTRDPASGAITAVVKPLQLDVDYKLAASGNGEDIVVIPLQPFPAETSYLLGLTKILEDTNGNPLTASSSYQLLRGDTPLTDPAAIPLQAAIRNYELILGQTVDLEDVIYSAVFTVQAAGTTLNAVRDSLLDANAPELSYNPLAIALPPEAADPQLLGQPFTFGVASLELPYFLLEPSLDNCDLNTLLTTQSCAGLESVWSDPSQVPVNKLAPLPQATDTGLEVEVLVTLPSSTKPETGWPVVIFSHGITSVKEGVLALAGALAERGIATISIDHPLHGSRSIDLGDGGAFEISASSGLKDDPQFGALYANANVGVFTNIASPLTIRDNLRQSVVDLLSLRLALNDFPDEFDLDQVSFVGQSLGASIGAVFVALAGSNDTASNAFGLDAAVLHVPGQGLAGVFGYGAFGEAVEESVTGSEEFLASVAGELGTDIEVLRSLRDSDDEAQLAQWQAIATPAFDSFLPQLVFALQTIIDSADPVSYLAELKNSGVPIYLAQVNGDTTIPNSNENNGLPLSGTEPLIAGLELISADDDITGDKVAVRFTAGSHSSLLDFSASLAATLEMQSQVAEFIDNGGTALVVTDDGVLR